MRYRRGLTLGLCVVLSGMLSLVGEAAVPKADYFYPAGGQRGTQVSVKVGGATDWPVSVWVSCPGVSVVPAKETGMLQVTVSPEAPLGVCYLRLFNADGTTSPRPFVIGHLPEVSDAGSNNTVTKPQVLEQPAVVVNGRFEAAADVDVFAMQLQAGQSVVARMEANGLLGSGLDGILQVLDAQGFVLEQNDDHRGFDPQVAFTATKAGRYLIRTFCFPAVPNSTIALAGGEAFVYRLMISTTPTVDYTFPFALTAGQPSELQLHGWNLTDPQRKLSISVPLIPEPKPAAPKPADTIPADTKPADTKPAEPKPADAKPAESKPAESKPADAKPVDAKPVVAGSVSSAEGLAVTLLEESRELQLLPAGMSRVLQLPVESHPVLTDVEPNEAAQPQAIALPVTISGRLGQPRDVDAFNFSAKKGQAVRCRLESRSYGFATDGVLTLINSAGKEVLRVDDPTGAKAAGKDRDPELAYTIPADGEYTLTVSDLLRRGGPEFAYYLQCVFVQPDYRLTVAADSFSVAAGKTVEVAVTVERAAGFASEIEVTAVDLPEGVTATAVKSAVKSPTDKGVKLVLTAGDKPVSGSFRLQGEAAGMSPAVRFATAPLTAPAGERTTALWITVTGAKPAAAANGKPATKSTE